MRKKGPDEPTPPLVMGTGLVALDVVVTADDPAPPKLWAGGTCGNVLLALRYLGFDSAPVCRLRDDPAAALIIDEFRAWGVLTEYVSTGGDGSTPVIVETIRRRPAGDPIHTFSWRCPVCGARFPGYKSVLASSAEVIAAKMSPPQVFFFDRLSRGSLVLAARAAELGSLVVFEPSGVGDSAQFREAWSASHVVKYSHERLAELPDGLEFGPNLLLQVETLGAEGLRYRARFRKQVISPWQTLPAVKAPSLKDTAGAGDWATTGLLHRLGRAGATGFRNATPEEVLAALQFGQALAAWNCAFAGARGGMYVATAHECLEQVGGILAGRDAGTGNSSVSHQPQGIAPSWCPTCTDHQSPSVAVGGQPRRTTA